MVFLLSAFITANRKYFFSPFPCDNYKLKCSVNFQRKKIQNYVTKSFGTFHACSMENTGNAIRNCDYSVYEMLYFKVLDPNLSGGQIQCHIIHYVSNANVLLKQICQHTI